MITKSLRVGTILSRDIKNPDDGYIICKYDNINKKYTLRCRGKYHTLYHDITIATLSAIFDDSEIFNFELEIE